MILPYEVSSWKKVIKFIKQLFDEYNRKIKSISDVIINLRQIRLLFEGLQHHLYYEEIFSGLGVFLENLKSSESRQFIDVSFRNILYYSQLVDQIAAVRHNEFIIKDNMVNVSMMSAKSILACSVLCVFPKQSINIDGNTIDDQLSVNMHQLYIGIIHGSKNHTQLLKSIFQFFLTDPLISVEQERVSFITLIVSQCDPSPFVTNEPLRTWPIVLTSKANITDIPLPNSLTLWPMYFPRILPANLFSSSNLMSELPIYCNLPVLVALLPLLTLNISENIGAINVKWHQLHCALQKVHFLNSWNTELQYAKESIVENIAHSLSAIKSSQKLSEVCDTTFANNFTQSVIDDAIQKLNSKTPTLTYVLRSNSYGDSITQTRSSLTSQVLPKCDGSLGGSGNPVARATRHSYSNSSSSRSGSFQMSSFSSRRSSSNTSSSTSSGNKDTEYGIAVGDKVDYSLHNFQPVIVEESGNHVDEEDQVTPLEKMMSTSISDAKKLSLSKELIHETEKKTVADSGMKRRNSSPLLRASFKVDDYEDRILFEEKSLVNRCCEEDANNDHLVRRNHRNRRQSLPCHLQWLYQSPLTHTTKINLSRSRSNIDNDEICDQSTNDDLLGGRIIIESKETLAKLVALADGIVKEIVLNDDKSHEQCKLRMEILKKRNLFEKFCLVESTVGPGEDHSLHSGDLATFDRVLNSSTFFDNEAFNFFSKLSTMSSPSSVWTPHEDIFISDNQTVVADPISHHVSNASTIVDYVNQLTTSIITDVMDHEYGPAPRALAQVSRDQCIHKFADRLSLDIVTTSLMHFTDQNKVSPIFVRAFPIEYDRQLSVIIHMLAGAISQLQTKRSHVLVFDRVTVEMEEVIGLLEREPSKCSPENVFRAIMTLIKETGTISISNLISYLTHNC